MIFDRMERLAQYKGLNGNLDALIDYVLAHDCAELAPGRHEIDGDNCWLSSNVAELAPSHDTYEHHREYIDLQIPIDDGEIIQIQPVEALAWPESDAETVFADGPAGLPLDMAPGAFAVFFPGDAHNCGISKSGQARVRKLVGKARV